MTRLSELGESHVLQRLLSHTHTGSHVVIGPGDDAAVTAVEGQLVSTADMLVEGEDFTRAWLDWARLGRKAAAQNLSDVCVMGARPHGLLVSLAVPNSTDIDELEALFAGIVAEAGRAGAELGCEVPIIGGDLSSSGLIVVAITALGTLSGEVGPGGPDTGGVGGPILRSGARPGEGLWLAGTVGRAAAGLDLLFAGVDPDETASEFADLIAAQLAPRPDYAAMRSVRQASAMIDVSDGLSTDLARISSASGVGVDLERARLDELIAPLLPAARFLTERAGGGSGRLGAGAEGVGRGTAEDMALGWVLHGGEDHGFAASCPVSAAPGVGWRRIGEISAGRSVSLDGAPVPTSGFSHFGK